MARTEQEPELTARLAVLEERLAELEEREHDTDSVEAFFARLLPSEVRGHLRAARKEQLLAARSLLDHWIDRLDRRPAEPRRRRESIKLE